MKLFRLFFKFFYFCKTLIDISFFAEEVTLVKKHLLLLLFISRNGSKQVKNRYLYAVVIKLEAYETVHRNTPAGYLQAQPEICSLDCHETSPASGQSRT